MPITFISILSHVSKVVKHSFLKIGLGYPGGKVLLKAAVRMVGYVCLGLKKAELNDGLKVILPKSSNPSTIPYHCPPKPLTSI